MRGPHVMAGYWRQPELTAEMLVDGPVPGERMLCTHDHFTVDADGFLYFVGRTDDIIKTRGEKVSPLEVENALVGITRRQRGGGRRCSGRHARRGDPRLRRARERGRARPSQEVIAACRLTLEAFMVPQQVTFLDELPKTDSGKVRKKSLLEAV